MALPNAARSTLRAVATMLVGYGLGTVPSAVVAVGLANRGRELGLDPRRDGTSNPGAANVSLLVGKRWAAAVTLADMAKGIAGSAAGRSLSGPGGAHLGATAAVLGHCYPLWPGSKGGKGVATSIGQVVGTFPAFLPIDIAVATAFNFSGLSKQRTRFATNAASTVWVAAGVLWCKKGWANGWGPSPSPLLPVASAVSAMAIAQRFRSEQGSVDDFNSRSQELPSEEL